MMNAKDGNRSKKRRASAAQEEQEQEQGSCGPLLGRLKQRTLCVPNQPSDEQRCIHSNECKSIIRTTTAPFHRAACSTFACLPVIRKS